MNDERILASLHRIEVHLELQLKALGLIADNGVCLSGHSNNEAMRAYPGYYSSLTVGLAHLFDEMAVLMAERYGK